MELWDEVPVAEDISGYIQLPYSSRHFLIAYAAGPDLLRRRSGSLQEAVGTSEVLDEDFEQDIIELNDGALAQAGIPPVPPGYVWFLRLPPGVYDADGLWTRLGELAGPVIAPLGGATPESEAAILAAYRGIMRSLYADDPA